MRLLLLLCFFGPILIGAQTWSEIDPFPGSSRDDAVSFKIGDTVYGGTGIETGWIATRDFYAFDCTSENWFQVASMPAVEERQYASGWSYNGQGYVFGGRASGQHFNDLWKYDPVADSWSELTALPDIGRSGAHSFVIQDEVFIVGGQTNNSDATDEVWKYDLPTDTWFQLQDLPFGGRWRGTAEVINDTAYLIAGRTANGHFPDSVFRYLPSTDEWEFESTTPFSGRAYLKSTVIDEKMVICFGLDSLNQSHNDVWHYDVNTNQWEQEVSLPALNRRGGLAFSHNMTLYYTTGIDQNNDRLTQTWKLENATSVEKHKNDISWKVFPNPTSEIIHVKLNPTLIQTQLRILDMNGQIMLSEFIEASSKTIVVSDIPAGFYVVKIEGEEVEWKKFVKL